MRISVAGLALLTRPLADRNVEYLVRWNDRWGMFSLVGGHVEAGETYRECCEREVAEELGLTPGTDYAIAADPVGPPCEYSAMSGSAGVETLYRVGLYAIELLTPTALARVAADTSNQWLTDQEIDALTTVIGRPVSAQVRTVLRLFKVLRKSYS